MTIKRPDSALSGFFVAGDADLEAEPLFVVAAENVSTLGSPVRHSAFRANRERWHHLFGQKLPLGL